MSGGGAAVGRMRGDYGDWKRVYRYAFRYRPAILSAQPD